MLDLFVLFVFGFGILFLSFIVSLFSAVIEEKKKRERIIQQDLIQKRLMQPHLREKTLPQSYLQDKTLPEQDNSAILNDIEQKLSEEEYNRKAGEYGEKKVYANLKQKNNFIINNFTFMTPFNSSVQIDHILIDLGGIHIIETKNWSGKVFGSEDDDTWTVINKKGQKNQYTNAFAQNEYHIEQIKNIIPKNFHSLIDSMLVFVNTNSVKLSLSENKQIFKTNDGLLIIKNKFEVKTNYQTLKYLYRFISERDEHIPLEEHLKNIKKS